MSVVDSLTLQTVEPGSRNGRVASKRTVNVSREEFTQRFIDTLREKKGAGRLTYLTGPSNRPRQQRADAADALRTNPEYGLVVDNSSLKVKGWTPDDYFRHWSEVRQAFAKDMLVVMLPGWEKNQANVREAVDARDQGIPLVKIELRDLDRTTIHNRLEDSTRRLRSQGFETADLAAVLDGAIDESYLADVATSSFVSKDQDLPDPQAYLQEVVRQTLEGHDDTDSDGGRKGGKMPQPEFTRLYLQAAQKILNGRPMTYVSTPITGGRKKFDFLTQHGVHDKSELDAASKNQFVDKVITSNTNRVFHVAEALRMESEHAMVMDPAEITVPEWSQAQYSAHWDAVVHHLAAKIVLVPDWDLSQGCVLELNRALSKGIPIQEIRIAPVENRELPQTNRASKDFSTLTTLQ